MDDQKQQEDRWAELAELLGISGDASPPVKPAPAVPPAPAAPEAMGPAPSLFEPPAESSSDVEDDCIDDEDEEELDAPGPDEVEVGESAEAVESAPAEDGDKPKRGRRRRRRGRRRGGESRPEGQEAAERPEPAKPSRVAAAPSGARDRSDSLEPVRAASRQDDQTEFDDDDADEFIEESPAAQTGFPDEDLDFSDWNVPSWQELISSLYRPDR